jgi:hypothetical protein
MLEYHHRLIQQIDPVYLDPADRGYFDFRAHFYAPVKHFKGSYYDTYWFNMIIIWCFTLFFYLTLYFDALKKLLDLPEKIRMKRK